MATLDEAEQALRSYEQDTNAEEIIRKTITDAYGGLKNELEQIARYENSQLPQFYDQFHGYGMGTSASDMSPTMRLATATAAMGRQAAAAQAARNVFDVRRAGMEDLIARSYNQWQQGYTGAQNAYARALEIKRNEEQMALAREQMRRSSYGGFQGRPLPTPPPNSNPSIDPEIIRLAGELYSRDVNNNYGPFRGGYGYGDPATNRGNVNINRGNFNSTPSASTPVNTSSGIFNTANNFLRGL